MESDLQTVSGAQMPYFPRECGSVITTSIVRSRSHTSGQLLLFILIAALLLICWGFWFVDSARAQELNRPDISKTSQFPGTAENLKAQAEKVKADAEMVKAQADAKRAGIEEIKAQATGAADNLKAQADKLRADAEMAKAQVEAKKIDLEEIKTRHLNTQFYLDWAYKVVLLFGAAGILYWLFPQIQEFSFPWGTGIASLKRAPKEPGPAAPPSASGTALLDISEIEHAKKGLMEATGLPAPAAEGIIVNLDEIQLYKTAGIARDSIYACHRARKLPKSDYYQVQIYLDADETSTLDKIEKVTYLLHPTFQERQRTLTKSGDRFQLEIKVWGEFMLYALVYFKGQAKPIQLKRYLNF